MQKDLVPSMSLFCHAPTPVAGTTTRMHDRDNKNEFWKDAIDDGVRITMKETSPDIAKLRATRRKPGNLRQNSISLL